MIKIKIDGKYFEVKPGRNLLEACLSLGINIPHFCFHPALGSVGACRLCAVKKFKDADDTRGRIVMSCMEPVTDGLIISVEDTEVQEFRASVIEGLMTNHPHDCPVCDEGGECHLQDMTIMTGHNYRQFDFKKRTFKNQDLGPFISHEMNRCIECYRCVRFYRDYAGGKDLNVFGAHNHVYFGREKDGTLENVFSGNLVEVCPTGVFTDKTFKNHFVRKWDLTNSPSVCVHCSLGCNTIVGERYDSLRRVMNRYNGAVNGYFICDRGRFGYEFVNSDDRIYKAELASNKKTAEKDIDNRSLNEVFRSTFAKDLNIVGIGSPRASVESNYALLKLVGAEKFYHGISENLDNLTGTITNFMSNSGVEIPSLKQIETADAVLIVGEDLINTAPMAALAVRQAVRNKSFEEADKLKIPRWDDAPIRLFAQDTRSPLFILTPFSDSLDDVAKDSYRGSPEDIANIASAVSSMIREPGKVSKDLDKNITELVSAIALALKDSKKPLIIAGTSLLDADTLNSAMNVALSLRSPDREVMFSAIVPESNSIGLSLMPGKSLDGLFRVEASEKIDTLVILENDLYRRAYRKSVDELLGRCDNVVVLDHLKNSTTFKADILLPAATFAESQGTLVNNEGRAQRFYKAVIYREQVSDSWKWLYEIMAAKDGNDSFRNQAFDNVVSSLAGDFPAFSKLKDYMPDADMRMLSTKIPRQTLRYSGRTAIHANIDVNEPEIPRDDDSALSFSMEGQPERPPSSLVPFYWSPGWNSVQALYHYVDEPGGSMKGGDPGIRLIDSVKENDFRFFTMNDKKKNQGGGEFLLLPYYQTFGSDELSSYGPSVSKKTADPFICINVDDAVKSGIEDGQTVIVEVQENRLELKVRVDVSIIPGIAGISAGFPGMTFIDWPAHGKILKI